MRKAKRPRRLVSGHLERVSGTLVEKHRDVLREFVRGRQGVYALYRKKSLYYVGLASNLPNRLASHLHDRHQGRWQSFSLYVTLSDQHLKELESLILRITSPKGNKVKGKLAGSENLKPYFKRRVQESYDREVMRLFGEERRPAVLREALARPVRGGAVLAPYAGKGFEIRLLHKGHIHRAIVRKDGVIRFGGELFTSPSKAGAKAIGVKALNGWKAWKYRAPDGEWVYIDELRRKANGRS